MSNADTAEETDRVKYQFTMPRENWRRWADTVPRSTPLDARLRTLIDQDYRAAARAGDNVESGTVNVMASRIRIRAMQAVGALRDDDDPDAAREQLQEIMDIADALES